MHVECTQEEKEKKWSWNSICNSDFFPVGSEDILNKSQTLPRVVAVFPEAPAGPDPGFKAEDNDERTQPCSQPMVGTSVYMTQYYRNQNDRNAHMEEIGTFAKC